MIFLRSSTLHNPSRSVHLHGIFFQVHLRIRHGSGNAGSSNALARRRRFQVTKFFRSGIPRCTVLDSNLRRFIIASLDGLIRLFLFTLLLLPWMGQSSPSICRLSPFRDAIAAAANAQRLTTVTFTRPNIRSRQRQDGNAPLHRHRGELVCQGRCHHAVCRLPRRSGRRLLLRQRGLTRQLHHHHALPQTRVDARPDEPRGGEQPPPLGTRGQGRRHQPLLAIYQGAIAAQ
mmetsp:Transcript_53500/g.113624  ORF Transcript_53500/g.113624 Transcript_53500/m.113624 type:complete len:231 (+) Transcript_53500:841-1533(+)